MFLEEPSSITLYKGYLFLLIKPIRIRGGCVPSALSVSIILTVLFLSACHKKELERSKIPNFEAFEIDSSMSSIEMS